MTGRLEGAGRDYFRDDHSQYRRDHVYVLWGTMYLSRCGFCIHLPRVLFVVFQNGTKHANWCRLVVQRDEDDFRRVERVVLSFLLPAAYRRDGGQFVLRLIYYGGHDGIFQIRFLVDDRFIRNEISCVIGKVLVLPFGGLGFGEGCERRFICVAFSVLSTVLLPYPCLEECVVMSQCLYLYVGGFNGVGIRPQVVRRGCSVQVPDGGIFFTAFRVYGSDTRVGRCEGGSRVYRLFVVLRRFTTGDDR